LRELVSRLDEENVLARIKTEVDWNKEVGAIIARTNRHKGLRSPAILFEKLRGYPERYSLLTNAFLGTQSQAIVLGLPKEASPLDIVKEFKERIKHPIKPKVVTYGPCKENIREGENVDLYEFPAPVWNPTDGGRYLGTWHGVVTRDSDSDWVNVGLVRLQILDERTLGTLWNWRNHGWWHYLSYQKKNKPMPIAISIGHDELLSVCAGTNFPAYECEYDYAGALMKSPIEIVDCETVPLQVPANSEIVIEGEVQVDEKKMEGPFGEWTGYAGGLQSPQPTIKVKCVTYRSNPILRGSYLGAPPSENHIVPAVADAATAWEQLERAGLTGIKSVYILPDTGNSVAAVAIEQRYPSHAKDVGRTLLSLKASWGSKFIFVTDDDIDITNASKLLWAAQWRSQAHQDWYIFKDETGSIVDPSVPVSRRGFTSKVLIDCAWKQTPEFPPREEWGGKRFPPTAEPDKETERLVDKRWNEYGISNQI
jgi:UbiD family decarboxylase